MALALIPVALSEACGDILNPSDRNCTMLTPELTCTGTYNYTIFNISGQVITNDTLTLLNSSIYYLTFNHTVSECGNGCIVRLCDGTTREINVGDEDMALSLIVGLGLASFLFLAIAFKLDTEKHPIMKHIALLFSLFPLMLIPVVNIDATVANASFAKIIAWFFRILAAYTLLYMIYRMGTKSEELIQFFKQRFRR